jgi:hypothetical protein
MTQELSDFVAKWTETQTPPREREMKYWTINFDGSSTSRPRSRNSGSIP